MPLASSNIYQALRASDQHTPAVYQADDLAVLSYTSGRSKGAMLTHGNLLRNALVLPVPGVRLAAAQMLTHLQAGLVLVKWLKQCVAAAELPRSTLGKVQKNLLLAHHGG